LNTTLNRIREFDVINQFNNNRLSFLAMYVNVIRAIGMICVVFSQLTIMIRKARERNDKRGGREGKRNGFLFSFTNVFLP